MGSVLISRCRQRWPAKDVLVLSSPWVRRPLGLALRVAWMLATFLLWLLASLLYEDPQITEDSMYMVSGHAAPCQPWIRKPWPTNHGGALQILIYNDLYFDKIIHTQYIHACIHMFMIVHAYVQTHRHTYAYMHTHKHIHIHTHTHTYTYI